MSNDLHDPHEPDDRRPGASGTDPVNRWATEHYGFADDAPRPDEAASRSGRVRRPSTGQPRHRGRLILAAGVLGVALTAGLGGAAVAAVTDDDGRDGSFVTDGGVAVRDADRRREGDADGDLGGGGPRGGDR